MTSLSPACRPPLPGAGFGADRGQPTGLLLQPPAAPAAADGGVDPPGLQGLRVLGRHRLCLRLRPRSSAAPVSDPRPAAVPPRLLLVAPGPGGAVAGPERLLAGPP